MIELPVDFYAVATTYVSLLGLSGRVFLVPFCFTFGAADSVQKVMRRTWDGSGLVGRTYMNFSFDTFALI